MTTTPQIIQPQDYIRLDRKQPHYDPSDETWHIIDHSACYKHAYHGCDDPEGIFSVVRDKIVPRAEVAFASFIQRFLEPILSGDSLRNLIVVYDGGHKYRTALFPEYKQKRKSREKCEIETAEMDKLHTLLKEFYKRAGITQVGTEGVEADDVIGWLCGYGYGEVQSASPGLQGYKLVYTVDADLLQMVGPGVQVTLKDGTYTDDDQKEDSQGVVYNLALGENTVALAKALLGDPSDGYAGVAQFGPAKWIELRNAVGDDGLKEIEHALLFNDIDIVQGAQEQLNLKSLGLILNNWDHARLMLNLSRLHPELAWKPMGKALPKTHWIKRVANDEKVHSMMKQLGADDLYQDIIAPHMPVRFLLQPGELTDDYKDQIKAEIRKSPFVAFDYESYDTEMFECYRENDENFVDVLSQKVTGAVFTFGANLENSIYIPVEHKDGGAGNTNCLLDDLEWVLETCYQMKPMVAQNSAFEITLTSTNFNTLLEGVYDTAILSSYVDENLRSNLKYMSKAHLNYDQVDYKTTLANAGAENMNQITPQQVFGYGVDDGVVTASLFDLFAIRLQLEGSWNFVDAEESYTANPIHNAFVNGVVIDQEKLAEIYKQDQETLETNTLKLRQLLEENATWDTVDMTGVEQLIKDEKGNRLKLARDKYKKQSAEGRADPEMEPAAWINYKARQEVERWEAKMRAAAEYEPYVVEYVPVSFSPTAKQLTTVAEKHGLPPLEKHTKTYLREWLAEQMASGMDEDEITTPDPKQEEFCSRLGAFLPYMTKKDSEEYLEFTGWAAQFFEPKEVVTGDELSLGSPNQMQELLYCKLGLPVRLRTKPQKGSARENLGLDGNPGTDDKAIKMAQANDCEGDFAWKGEALKLILEAKAAQTRIGLYHKPYPNWIRPIDGRMHPGIRNCGTTTRRPAGGSPNILQVSKGDMRSIFLPPSPDYVAVPIDYAGQELRIMACQTMDPTLLSVYGVDPDANGQLVYDPDNEKCLHNMTASGILKINYEEFLEVYLNEEHENHGAYSKVRGKKAKGTNFGLSYGAGAETLSRNLTVPVEEADNLLSSALSTYPGIPAWQDGSAKYAARWGYTETAFGNRRHMTDMIFSRNPGERSRMERQGTNCEIQGTAADMLKKVLTQMWKSGLMERVRMVFFAPIYDEVVSWVHVDDVWDYWCEMKQIMSDATPPGHLVPQIPELSLGADWGNVSELGRNPSRDRVEELAKAAWERNQERLEKWS